jgi:intracellular multiplication protein IcmB
MTNLVNETPCADEESVKRRAYAIKERMNELGHKVPLTHAYEIVATTCGYRNWPTMKAALSSSTAASPSADMPRPDQYLATVGQSEFRLADGTPISYRSLLSSKPGAVELVYAPPGKGKSFLLNAMNIATVNDSVGSDVWDALPEIGIVDIGRSSKGLIELVRARLPASLENKASYHRLRMKVSDAINPFDTPLGLRRPSRDHIEFLVNFVLTMLHSTDSNPLNRYSAEFYESFRVSVRSAIVDLYEKHADDGESPKLFASGVMAEVDREIKRRGIGIKLGETTWWSVVDKLFDARSHSHAKMAQRHAVPLLADLLPVLSGRLALLATSIKRCLSELPILTVPTRIEKGDSLITVVDIDDVSPKGGGHADTQTGIMYMLARHFLCSEMFNRRADHELGKYASFHASRIAFAGRRTKVVTFDELHRVTSVAPILDQIRLDVLHAKDRGVRIRLASQLLSSFDRTTVKAATNIFVGGVQRRDTVGEHFDLSPAAVAAVTDMPGLSRNGMSFLAVIRENGVHEHLIRHMQASEGIWAFATTWADVALRDRLQELVGLAQALRTLAKVYPSGSASWEIEDRERKFRAELNPPPSNFAHLGDDVIEQLASELAALSASTSCD